jgi:hypothetical protein
VRQNNGDWNCASPSLQAFLAASQAFFDGQERLITGRRQQAMEFLNGLDLIPAGLPQDVQKKNAEEWMSLKGYFTGVSHHGSTDEDTFRSKVGRLEGFLSARLVPRPTDDFAAIDELLEED